MCLAVLKAVHFVVWLLDFGFAMMSKPFLRLQDQNWRLKLSIYISKYQSNDRSCCWGMNHTKIHLVNLDYPRPSSARQ